MIDWLKIAVPTSKDPSEYSKRHIEKSEFHTPPSIEAN